MINMTNRRVFYIPLLFSIRRSILISSLILFFTSNYQQVIIVGIPLLIKAIILCIQNTASSNFYDSFSYLMSSSNIVHYNILVVRLLVERE
ncbi:hypothetical protein SCEN_D02380 [Saccharomyces cerevisiae]|nr:hypothetical protein SCEN_D02380 [Saccharomyces cerevisiae]